MLYIKARFQDTNKILQVEGVEDAKRGELLVVSSEKGEEIVKVIGVSKEPAPFKGVFLRRANKEDIRKMEENLREAQRAEGICKEKISLHGLEMKLLKAYIPLDRSRIFFYYTAEQKVDFRALVRDLAKVFKRRIEMRQVGVRDAVQMLGWIGSCGELPCCVKFQEEFASVYLKDIEEQNLPLSPQKFTGPCGRLLCCLTFERENYMVKNLLPDIGSSLCYEGKEYTLMYVDPIRETVLLRSEEGKRQVKLHELLPTDYQKALEHCKSCGGCCRRWSMEHETSTGIEQ